MDDSSPPRKKRKRSAFPSHPLLKDAVRSSVTFEDNAESDVGTFDEKELWLIQLPKHLDPKQLEGQTISTAKSCCFNCCNKNYEARISEQSTKDSCSVESLLLLPSQKAGRLTTGPELCNHLTIHQKVALTQVDISHIDEKIETKIPGGLKQRWKPFGYKEPYLPVASGATESTSSQPLKRKHKKKKLKGHVNIAT